MGDNHGRDARATKTTATPPTGNQNRVNDLGITDNGDGTFTLNWHYRNLGDYDQDGKVGISDITPLAEHFGESVPESDTERNSLPAVIDGSGNGRIGIEDVTPIAVCFQRDVEHYVIEGAEAQGGPWAAVGEVAQDAGTGEGRLIYEHILSGAVSLWHRVVPYDAEGNPGEPSNTVLRPSNEPIIYSVSPTEGYQHEEYTFTATVSGAEPRAYAWDFGGGAEPNASSGISPTVTLSDVGEYEASLTVTNAYGEASYPSSITILERDSWLHTWGGTADDLAGDVALDDEGNVYVAGVTYSFGADGSDVLLIKCDSSGNLLYARTWGSSGEEGAKTLLVGDDGAVTIVGTTSSFGEGADDVLLLKYDPYGALLFAKTWGGSWIESVAGAAIGPDGNLYVAGERGEFAFDPWDIFLLKCDSDGNLENAVSWDDGRSDSTNGIAITDSGAVYLVGESRLETDSRAVLLVYNLDGTFLESWAAPSLQSFHGVVPTGESNIILWGAPPREGTQPLELCLMELTESLDVLWAKSWASAASIFVSDATLDARGGGVPVGAFDQGSHNDALTAGFDDQGNPLWGSIWLSSEAFSNEYFVSAASYSNGDVYAVGAAPHTDGEWQDVAFTVYSPDVSFEAIAGISLVLELPEGDAEGAETEPVGVQDVGGGMADAVLGKNIACAAH